MSYSFFLLLFSMLLSVLFTPLSMKGATLMGAVDLPDGNRKCHARPTPRLAGLSIFGVCFLGAVLFLPMDDVTAAWLSGGAILCGLGVSDDLFSLPPFLKLAALAAISVIPVAYGLTPDDLSLGTRSFSISRPIGNLFCAARVMLLADDFNLIDGADGVCATLSLIPLLPLCYLLPHDALFLFAGAVLGFFPYNRHALSPLFSGKMRTLPTRTFLGDTGALFIGYSLALFSLQGAVFSLFTPLLFAIPLFDMTRVFFLRLLKKKNPFRADRSHLHHRLADRGLLGGEILLLFALYALLCSCVYLLLSLIF
jgi:UDP-GlcNAc:undecaprenyl-phosphate GlcNAc-1-phosphate transferase